jgi:hypothetical protein
VGVITALQALVRRSGPTPPAPTTVLVRFKRSFRGSAYGHFTRGDIAGFSAPYAAELIRTKFARPVRSAPPPPRAPERPALVPVKLTTSRYSARGTLNRGEVIGEDAETAAALIEMGLAVAPVVPHVPHPVGERVARGEPQFEPRGPTAGRAGYVRRRRGSPSA